MFSVYLAESEEVTKQDLDKLENYLDNLFKMLGMDIGFTRHFLDRVNDIRNGKQITIKELLDLFNKQFQKHGNVLKSLKDAEVVLKDINTDINTPVIIEWNPQKKMLEMRAKTVMRKKNFFTPDRTLRV